uniref:DNA topoisomerase 2 n=1 Tax=Ditylenchus dipsaci TaxID=166011 RepID=A0A915CWD3_9BILA
MKELDDDIISLMCRRAFDVAGTSRGVQVVLNNTAILYVDRYIKDRSDDSGEPLKVAFEHVNDRWEIGIAVSDRGFQQVSFVNSIATSKGGRHVDYVADQVVSKLIETVKKKIGKNSIAIKPFQIKNHMWIFVNSLIENPTFDSQTKETMTLQAKNFGSICDLSDKFIKEAHKVGIVESIMSWVKFKQTEGLDKRVGKNLLKSRMSPNWKTPMMLEITENAEICNMLKIVGLKYKEKYENDEKYKELRYGKIMIMADQDQDGSHIKGLVINFIHCNWPNLIKRILSKSSSPPLSKPLRARMSAVFTPFRRLGTSTSKEAKEYFSDMTRHRILFKYGGPEDDNAVDLAFSKKRIEDRKDWLNNWMETRKQRRLQGESEDYLYDKSTRVVTYSDFINKELVLFSNADNERSIPSLVDGLKPGQRKVLFTCFKRADKKEVKVAQLAGAVGEMSAYHHGEQSLMMTIVGLAQDFVGSNNINLLLPIGQFGTRLQGGKDSASPRYIFTQLNPVTKALFPAADENVLRFLYEENQRIEPEWYCPVIPAVLVNGAEGIGTGWSTKVPNYNPRHIINNIRRLIRGEGFVPMTPWYKHFSGTINQLVSANDQQEPAKYVASGEIATLSDDTVEIIELPIKTWTQNYKESVIEPMLESANDKQPQILDFKEYHSDQTVKFIVKMTPQKLREAEQEGLHKFFKLQVVIHTSSMVLFDSVGCLRRFNNTEEICRDFFEVRKKLYVERKRWIEGMLRAQSERLSQQARFILMKIDGRLVIENKRKTAIVKQLVENNFAPDPVKKWKDDQKKLELAMCGEASVEEEEQEEDEVDGDDRPEKSADENKASDYDYLAGMTIWKLSMEEKNKLLEESESKKNELRNLQNKSWSDLWEEDLTEFEAALDKQEQKEKADIEESIKNTTKKLLKEVNAGNRSKKQGNLFADIKPNPNGIRIQPTLEHMKEKYEVKVKRVKPEKPANEEPKAKRVKKEKSVEPYGIDDDQDEENDFSPEDVDPTANPVKSRPLKEKNENAPKKTAPKKKKGGSSEEESVHSEDDYFHKKSKSKKRVAAPMVNAAAFKNKVEREYDEVMEVSPKQKPKSKAVATKKAEEKKAKTSSKTKRMDMHQFSDTTPSAEAEPPEPRPRRATKKIIMNDSEDATGLYKCAHIYKCANMRAKMRAHS